MIVDPSLVDKAYEFIRHVCETFGPRFSCSDSEKNANLWIKDKFSEICDKVHREEFDTHPDKSPHGALKITGFLIGISWLFIPTAFPFPILSIALVVVGLIVLYSEFLQGYGWFSFLFKKGRSSNVYGVIKPRGEIKFRVMIEGHVDSAKQMRMMVYESVPLKRFLLGLLFILYTFVFAIVKLFLPSSAFPRFFMFQLAPADLIYFIPWLVLFPCFLFVIWGLVGNEVVQGAADNLSGISCAYAVGSYLSENRPQNVEVIIGSMGSEENGSKGAAHFVKSHPDLLENTYVYVIDNAGAGNVFHITERDRMHGISSSTEVTSRMLQAAARYKEDNPESANFKLKVGLLGSGDSAPYIKAGFHAAQIVGKQEISKKGKQIAKPPNWHTTRDTWEKISKKMLRDSIGVAIEFIKMVDGEHAPK
ncbi:MAG: M28 family metallopeptidase [Candidatus Hodarchaeota archaeon]